MRSVRSVLCTPISATRASALLPLALLAACGGPPAPPETVEDSLDRLGVDITETDRVDVEGSPLPEDFAPLGSAPRLNITHEWMVSGATLDAHGGPMSLLETEAGGETLLTGGDVPWGNAGRVRDVVAGDVDGDGLEETIAVYRDAADITWVQVMDDEEGGFELSDPLEVSRADVRDVAAVAGDFDGDNVDEVMVSISTEGGSTGLRVVLGANGLRLDADPVFEVPVREGTNGNALILDRGNLDHDKSEELVVVVNHHSSERKTPDILVFDDLQRDFAVMHDQGAAVLSSDITASVFVADVGVGDVDDDGIDEIVVGGIQGDGTGGSCGERTLLLFVVDDAVGRFQTLSAVERSKYYRACVAYAPMRLEFAHVNVLELDGDRGVEIAINEFIYDDLTQHSALTPLFELPDDALMIRQNRSARFNRGSSDVVVGDVTGDGKDDLVMLSQSAHDDIVVWGMHPIDGWSEQARIPYVGRSASSPQWIDLTAVDVDVDGMALAYDAGERKLVFSEPVILAALAAAPCYESLDQHLSACRTAWGTSTSETSGIDGSISVSAGITAGFGGEIFGTGAEVTATVTARASFSAAKAYETTKSVAYTTGPIEDSVVFTSVPYDQWTYTVTSHPDPELVGEKVVLSIPREPVTLMVEREFYNDSVVDGSTRVFDNVFQHVVGDPTTYRTATQRDAVMGADGLASDPITVGQGNGDVAVGIEVSESTTYRAGAEVSYERNLRTTGAGVIGGLSIGGSVDAGLSWGSGEATRYEGRVGQLGAKDFADNYYTFGLFTYVANVDGQEFEVLDYWVE